MVTRWLPRTSLSALISRSRVTPNSLKMRAGGARVVGHGQQQVLDGDVVVLELLGLVLGVREQLVEPAGDVEVVRRPLAPVTRGSFSSSRCRRIVKRFGSDAGLLQDGRGQPALLIEQRDEQVFDVDLLMAHPDGELLRTLNGLASFFGEAIDVHGIGPLPVQEENASVVPEKWHTHLPANRALVSHFPSESRHLSV